MKRRLSITVEFEVDADVIDPTASSPDGWDYRFARIEDEARLALGPIVERSLGPGASVSSRASIGHPYDPDNEPF